MRNRIGICSKIPEGEFLRQGGVAEPAWSFWLLAPLDQNIVPLGEKIILSNFQLHRRKIRRLSKQLIDSDVRNFPWTHKKNRSRIDSSLIRSCAVRTWRHALIGEESIQYRSGLRIDDSDPIQDRSTTVTECPAHIALACRVLYLHTNHTKIKCARTKILSVFRTQIANICNISHCRAFNFTTFFCVRRYCCCVIFILRVRTFDAAFHQSSKHLIYFILKVCALHEAFLQVVHRYDSALQPD